MDITKEDYFNVKYNSDKDILEIDKNAKKGIFRKHKFLTGALGTTFILCAINLYLVYKFFEILCAI